MTNRAINLAAFIILAGLWVLFGAAVLLNPGALDSVWQAFTSWPLVAQALVALLALPVAAGLWIWETSWPLLLRLLLCVGLAVATVYTFYPRKPQAQAKDAVQSA